MDVKKIYTQIEALEKRVNRICDDIKELNEYAQEIERIENEGRDIKKLFTKICGMCETLNRIENTALCIDEYTSEIEETASECAKEMDFDVNEALELYKKGEIQSTVVRDLILDRYEELNRNK